MRDAVIRCGLGRRLSAFFLVLGTASLLLACGEEGGDRVAGDSPVDRYEGLPAFRRLSDEIACGGRPVTPTGFAKLAELGFDTVVSVESAVPDVDAAARYGLKTYHIPTGFGALETDGSLKIAAAAHAAVKGVYLHCDDGAARGPTAAVLAHMSRDALNIDEALTALRQAGVNESHAQLFGAVIAFKRPSKASLDEALAGVASSVPPSGVAAAMTEIQARSRRLEAWGAQDWHRPPPPGPTLGGPSPAPPPYSDLSAQEQARALASAFEGLPLPTGKASDLALFRQYRTDATMSVRLLAHALRRKEVEKADRALVRLNAACTMCHDAYRK